MLLKRKLSLKKCDYCGKVYQPYRINAASCGGVTCKKKHYQKYQKNYHQKYYKLLK